MVGFPEIDPKIQVVPTYGKSDAQTTRFIVIVKWMSVKLHVVYAADEIFSVIPPAS